MSTPGRSRRPRRTQAERSATTRAALLDATLDCLVELGYSGTTTTEVAHRAGVSLGALVHHFPTKVDLLVTAVEHLLERRLEEFRKAFAEADLDAPDSVGAALDLMWSIVAGDTFIPWLELWVAARTDAELRPAMLELDRRNAAVTAEVFEELFPAWRGGDPLFHRLGRSFAFAVMDGLALQRVVEGAEHPPPEEILAALKVVARPFLPAAGAKADTGTRRDRR